MPRKQRPTKARKSKTARSGVVTVPVLGQPLGPPLESPPSPPPTKLALISPSRASVGSPPRSSVVREGKSPSQGKPGHAQPPNTTLVGHHEIASIEGHHISGEPSTGDCQLKQPTVGFAEETWQMDKSQGFSKSVGSKPIDEGLSVRKSKSAGSGPALRGPLELVVHHTQVGYQQECEQTAQADSVCWAQLGIHRKQSCRWRPTLSCSQAGQE